jgi:hypothetical protein
MSLTKLLTLRAFAMNYHSGQWSRGYRILSMTHLRLKAKGFETGRDTDLMLAQCMRSKLYKYLVKKYGDKM